MSLAKYVAINPPKIRINVAIITNMSIIMLLLPWGSTKPTAAIKLNTIITTAPKIIDKIGLYLINLNLPLNLIIKTLT